MSGGSNEKFMELKKSYEILQEYMDSYSFSFEESEFKKQFPAFTNYKIGLNRRIYERFNNCFIYDSFKFCTR